MPRIEAENILQRPFFSHWFDRILCGTSGVPEPNVGKYEEVLRACSVFFFLPRVLYLMQMWLNSFLLVKLDFGKKMFAHEIEGLKLGEKQACVNQ